MSEENFFYKFIQRFKTKKICLSIFLIALFAISPYLCSLFSYFQADEWYFLANNYSYLDSSHNFLRFFFVSLLDASSFNSHFTPFVQFIAYFQTLFFGSNFILYQLMSIILHVLVSLSVFYLAFLLSKKNLLFSFLAGMFFALAASSYQAVAWVAASSTQISLLFSLLSLIFIELYIINFKKSYKTLSLLFLILAVLTKENAIFLFFICPLLLFLKSKKGTKNLFKEIKPLLIFIIIYFVLREISSWIASTQYKVGEAKISYNLFVNFFDFSFIYKTITLFLKGIVQVFLPQDLIYKIGEQITLFGFPYYAQEAKIRGFNFLVFSQSAGMEIFIYPVSLVILALAYKTAIFFKKTNIYIYQAVIIGFAIIFFSIVPFIFIINSLINIFGYVNLLDSRHMYFVSVGAAFMFAAFLLYAFLKVSNKKIKIKRFSFSYIYLIYAFLVFWFCFQGYSILSVVNQYRVQGEERKIVLNTILKKVSALNKENLFLIESDTPYYGFPAIPPFQTNLGRILEIKYYENKNLPVQFINDDFFVKDINAQGYIKHNNRGFGYFINRDNLFKEILNKNLDPENIFAFKWHGKENKLTDITAEVRNNAHEYLEKVVEVKDWNNYFNPESHFSILMPNNLKLINLKDSQVTDDYLVDKFILCQSGASEFSYWDSASCLRISISKKPDTIGLGALVPFFQNSNGDLIQSNYREINVKNIKGKDIIFIYTLSGSFPIYYVASPLNDFFVKIEAGGSGYQRSYSKTGGEVYNQEINKIISTVDFDYERKE